MAVSETWLKPSINIVIDNYKVIRNDRLLQRGGGVCLIIHNSLCFSTINVPGSIGNESVTVQLNDCIRGKQDLYVTSLYNPPDTTINSAFLSTLLALGDHSLVLGDLNAHHPSWRSSSSNNSGNVIYDLHCENKLTILNNDEPTYEPMDNPDYKAILDFALCTEQLYPLASNFRVTDELRSDHVTICLDIDSKNPAYIRAERETKTIEKVNWDTFREAIRAKGPDRLSYTSQQELEASVEALTKTIQSVITEATETKQVTYDPDYHLRLPRFILQIIREKNRLLSQFKTTREPALKRQINKLQETIANKIREHKSNKWRTFCTSLNDHRVSDAILWRKIQTIESSTQEKPPRTPTLIHSGTTTADPRKVAQIFAQQQEAIFTEPEDRAFDAEFKQQVDGHHPHLFTYTTDADPEYTTLEEVNEQIKSLRWRGAPGPDKISNMALKRLPTTYRKELVHIINASIKYAHVPLVWKEATVVMLPKPMKDHKRAENFRPISLLNTMSKLLERIILVRLRNWIATKELLSKYQCGFRHNKQTKDQILRITQDVLKAFNCNQHLGAIFIDIEKAFDKVWHKGLLHNLDELQIPVYLGKWIQNYLTGRHFRVRVSSILSESKSIEAGVPQGSVLGPVLFNVYFNKVSTCTTSAEDLWQTQHKLAELAMFADDLSSWFASKKISIISSRLQQVLDNIELWMNKWRMKVSTAKTVCTVFNTRGQNMGEQLNLTYKQQRISSDPSPKFLGVTLDPALRLNKHTDIIVERANKRLNMIKSVRGKKWGASSKLTMIMYKTLVRPLIEYVPFVSQLLPKTNYMKLERIQRAAVRKAHFWPRGISTSDIYKKHNIESIKHRAVKLSERYLYKAYHTNTIIKELVDDYNIVPEFTEGAYCKKPRRPRTTVLGTIKKDSTVCNEIFKAISQQEQVEINQRNYANNVIFT